MVPGDPGSKNKIPLKASSEEMKGEGAFPGAQGNLAKIWDWSQPVSQAVAQTVTGQSRKLQRPSGTAPGNLTFRILSHIGSCQRG